MDSIQKANTGALAPSDYATFELAKQNDGIIGGSDIAQIRSYAAYARAQAQAIHKTIAATSGIEDVTTIKQEALETAQTFSKVSLYADTRIGELLRELPKAVNQHDAPQVVGAPTSTRQAERAANIDHHTAIDLQTIAANPDVVEAVIAQAEQDGRIVSRAQVLKEIRERDRISKEKEQTECNLANAFVEIAELKQQLIEQANAPQEPQVIEREVYPADYERIKADNKRQAEDYQRLREKWLKSQDDLRKANAILGETERVQEARRDVQYLTSIMKEHIRAFGMHSFSLDHMDEVDEPTKAYFVKTLTEDYAMLQNVVQTLIAKNQMNLERI